MEELERCDTLDLVEDIVVHLEEGDEEEFETNQQNIGIKALFR